MSTSYPTALDTLNNPLSTDSQLTVPHHSQHADANDAIEALQSRVGVKASISVLTSWASLKDYGAVGDGSTDDTSAIVSAINAGNGGGDIFVPPGTYISSPIALPPGVRLQGLSGQGYYNATTTVPNSATASRLKLKSGSTDSLIKPYDAGTNLATQVQIRDLALDCNAIAQSAINLPDQGGSISRFWRMERVYIVNVGNVSGGYAAYIGNQNTACSMRGVVAFNGTSGSRAGGDAIGWYGSDGIMEDCWIGYFSGNGLTYLGGTSDEFLRVVGGGIFTCTAGVVVGGRGLVLDGVSIDHNYNDGIYAAYDFTAIGCWFHTNSRQTANTWSNIRVDAAATANLIGCRATPHGGEVAFDPKYHISAVAGAVINDIAPSVSSSVTWGTAYTDYVRTGDLVATNLGSDTALTGDNSERTLLTSGSLALGRWLVTATVALEDSGTNAPFWDIGVKVGTAVGTIYGPSAVALAYPSSTFQFQCLTGSTTFIIDVTTAGTLLMRYRSPATGTLALKTGVNNNLGVSTGILAVRLGPVPIV